MALVVRAHHSVVILPTAFTRSNKQILHVGSTTIGSTSLRLFTAVYRQAVLKSWIDVITSDVLSSHLPALRLS